MICFLLETLLPIRKRTRLTFTIIHTFGEKVKTMDILSFLQTDILNQEVHPFLRRHYRCWVCRLEEINESTVLVLIKLFFLNHTPITRQWPSGTPISEVPEALLQDKSLGRRVVQLRASM